MSRHHGSRKQLFFKVCSDHLSIEAIPRSVLRVDLNQIKEQSIRGHELMMWTPQFVVLRNEGGQEITLRRDGRMIVRKAPTEEVAEDAAAALLGLVTR